jgi:hypothetical protein
VAGQRAKRKQRQRSASPRAVPSQRREQQAERARITDSERRAGERVLGKVGERPPSPFGGLPVSELLILVGCVGAAVGYFAGGVTPLLVGLGVMALGVVEFTAREHFSGYRSHTTLLAGIPAVGIEVAVVLIVHSRNVRSIALFAVLAVFGGLFWVLRRAFLVARQRRIARR